MRRRAWLLAFIFASAACAQQNAPHAAYVYPAGGRQGASVEVTVGGQFLDGAQKAIFSGTGVTAEVVGFAKPLAQKDLDELHNQLKMIEQSHASKPAPAGGKAAPPTPPAPPAPWTDEDRKLAADLHRQIDQDARMRMAPAFSQTVRLRVTIAANAAAGNHELRLLTDRGLTDPIVFLVAQLPEVVRPFQFVTPALATGGGLPLSARAHADAPTAPLPIKLPAIVNGQMMPGALDRYRFHARKGQPIVVAAMTRTLIPYMADAVPGWFQVSLTLADAAGNELTHADHFRFQQEPVLEYTIAADGDYMLSVCDILNRGREDFVYRIAIGEIPYVTGIFPLGGRAGSRTKIALAGWNLDRTQFKPDWSQSGVQDFSAPESNQTANPVAYAIDSLPETVASHSAATAAHAQRIKLPRIVNGRLDHPGATAYFRIDANAGEEIVAEVEARRLGSPLASSLTLTDARGSQLAFNDGFEDKGAALLTDQTDAKIAYRFSAKGSYYLQLADSEQNGGPDFAYRLRIGQPRPDFELRIAPSSINLHPGKTTPVAVLLLRRDGFNNAVKLRIKDGPSGLILGGGEITAGVEATRITLTAPPEAIVAPHRLVIEAEAMIAGARVRHEAIAADDRMQAFAWHHFVPAQQGLIWIVGKEHRKPLWTAPSYRLQIPAGRVAQYRLEIPKNLAGNQIKLALDDPPTGISLAEVKQSGEILQLSLRADAKLKPGVAGNLIVEASQQKNNAKPTPLDMLPAIAFEVVP